MSDSKPIKKTTETLVYNTLANALQDIAGGVKEKKFSRSLKKASKIIAGDIAKVAEKKAKKEDKASKAAKKAVAKKATKKDNGQSHKKSKRKNGFAMPGIAPAESIPTAANADHTFVPNA